jgi:hypothetical protein
MFSTMRRMVAFGPPPLAATGVTDRRREAARSTHAISLTAAMNPLSLALFALADSSCRRARNALRYRGRSLTPGKIRYAVNRRPPSTRHQKVRISTGVHTVRRLLACCFPTFEAHPINPADTEQSANQRAFINIKFGQNIPVGPCGRNQSNSIFVIDHHLVKGKPMKKAAVVFSAAAVMAMMAVSVPTAAQARGGWGWGPGIAGGLLAGALIGGFASSAYGYGPGYGYYGPSYSYYGPGYGYYGAYAPAYYGYGRPYYGPAYYPAYRPAYGYPYYGPGFRRVDWGG